MGKVTNMGRIVFIDATARTVVTWNYSATFNVWLQTSDGEWRNIDCFTRYNVADIHHAQRIANDWMDPFGEEYIAVMAEAAMSRD